MRADERRKAIAAMILSEGRALSGGELAARFDVSRQIIVSDIAVLKASGYDILSTHSGYIIKETPQARRVFKVYHTREETEDELNCIIDLGGTVVDVFVWHKIYGRMEAKLNIFSRLHIKQFIEGIRSGKSTELMNITGGYHYHTVSAESEEILDKIEAALESRGYTASGA